MIPVQDRLLRLSDVAAILGIGRRTVQTWRAAGKLPRADIAVGRVVRWKWETILKWMAENEEQGVPK